MSNVTVPGFGVVNIPDDQDPWIFMTDMGNIQYAYNLAEYGRLVAVGYNLLGKASQFRTITGGSGTPPALDSSGNPIPPGYYQDSSGAIVRIGEGTGIPWGGTGGSNSALYDQLLAVIQQATSLQQLAAVNAQYAQAYNSNQISRAQYENLIDAYVTRKAVLEAGAPPVITPPILDPIITPPVTVPPPVTPPPASGGGTTTPRFNVSPLLLVGGIAAAYLLTKKKGK